ncbi:carbonic anhydrase [Chroococcidiopsis cubana SAG 39.79]|uniref:carbonic anhydrase n=1 Tax=Chroococcidiopsis cubana SAG 39.79 TaxID=388085 RepID=A0AB37UHT6_9CYAN|nr:carbonic anhydrase [Chroococcidiopsis cubana]PSB54198.1 carbonic anhydrase [Chroococcidiopsis cubana CCALA 043]RUT10942.1 carbonic anhydrase [Chroococcidiopsis cubana SAG 39.79]
MTRKNGFVGRRNLLKLMGVGGASVAATTVVSSSWGAQPAVAQQTDTQEKPKSVSPDDALKRLVEGNQRFIKEKRQTPNQSRLRIREVAVAQYPFASILGCADSRVPAEIVFDQGLGDLFVVRLAGNVVSPTATGSLEFATSVLGSQLIIVLGHERCGAVQAALKSDLLPGRIGTFVEDIKPALNGIKAQSNDPVNDAVVANIRYQVDLLRQSSSILSQLIQDGKLKIVGGRYDLDTGAVTLVT